jgi:hypothetical protein
MNRKSIISILVVLASVLMLGSCESAFPDDRLDFYWRLDRVEFKDGVDFQNQPCQYNDIYDVMFGFARHIVQVEDLTNEFSRHGVTTDMGDSIRFDFSMYPASDTEYIMTEFRKCGLDSLVTTFKVEYPDRKHLVLSGRKTILRLRKW